MYNTKSGSQVLDLECTFQIEREAHRCPQLCPRQLSRYATCKTALLRNDHKITIMNRHQCIQSDALACPNALRAPFRPTSRLAPTLYRSALRLSLGAQAFGSGRRGSRSFIRAAAEPEGSIFLPATARTLCIPQTELNAYDGLYQQHLKQTNVFEW